MLRWSIRTQHLGGPSLEVGDDSVHRDAAAGDQNPCLSRGAKVDGHCALCERARDGEGTVFLAERAVRADRQKAFPSALASTGHRYVSWWYADVDQSSS